MKLLKTYVVAVFVVFLHFAGQLTQLARPAERYYYLWDRSDATARLLDVLLIALGFALLAWGLDSLAERWRSVALKRVLGHLFLVGLISGLLALFPALAQDHPSVVQLAWLVALAGIGFSLGWRRSRLVAYGVRFCLVLSPLALIGLAWMFTWPSWQTPPKTDFAIREPAGPSTPVFLVVFDEWSYPRSVSSGEFRPFFKNVRRLCRQSVVFRQARSAGRGSKDAIPRLIYQCDWQYGWSHGQAWWTTADRQVPSTEVPSLFQIARRHGYNTYLAGWYLPYGRILGDQVDYRAASRSFHNRGQSLTGEMAHAALTAAANMTDPLSRRVWSALSRRVNARRRWTIHHDLKRQVFRIIEQCPANTFAMFHVPLPHQPFIYNTDGTLRNDYDAESPEGYLRSLKYLDTYVGRLVEHLEATGKFDDALVVLTSNHGWREEPEPDFRPGPDWRRRVPLIIKLPGQRTGHLIDTPISTDHLIRLFQDIFSGRHDPQHLLRLVQDVAGASG